MFLKLIEYQIRWTNLIGINFEFIHSDCLVKICSIFDCPQAKCLIRHQKILWGCLFGWNNLSNFICLTIKFYNCHYTRLYKYSQILSIYSWHSFHQSKFASTTVSVFSFCCKKSRSYLNTMKKSWQTSMKSFSSLNSDFNKDKIWALFLPSFFRKKNP